MKNDWILDVLADLKQFARNNGLVALAEQLDDTTLIAATELMSAEVRVSGALSGDVERPRTYSGAYRAGENA